MNTVRAADIRRATLADMDVLAPLFDGYRQFYAQAPDLERAREYLRRRMQAGEAVVFLAEMDHDSVGFCLLYPGFSSVNTARTFVLNDLFVAETARRQRIGFSLLAAAVNHARREGAASISLETASDNHAAQALYRRAGWNHADTRWFYQSFT